MEKRQQFKMFFCAMIAEMDLAVCNLINLFFISRYLGTEGTAAYEIVMPCLMVVSAFMALGYNGMQAVCSKDYGAKEYGRLMRHKNAAYTWTLVVMALLTLSFAILRMPILDFLGAGDGSPALFELSYDCFMMFLPSFILQGMFCMASCLLFLEERRTLVTANIILYGCIICGNLAVAAVHPSMTHFIAVNVAGELAADIYLVASCTIVRRGASLAAFTGFRPNLKDIREIFLTGLPDFMEYVFVAVFYLVENMYLLSRFSESMVAGVGVFEAFENIPETICVGFCFLVTASFGTRAGRLQKAARGNEGETAEREAAEADLHAAAVRLTRFAAAGALITGIIMMILARPVVGVFLGGADDPGAARCAVLMIISYGAGFLFYILNSEIVSYYKVAGAYWPAHIMFFAEALLLPLALRILMGELFGLTGFCLGGAAAEAGTFVLNLFIVRKSCGHFPTRLRDFRMDRYLYRGRTN